MCLGPRCLPANPIFQWPRQPSAGRGGSVALPNPKPDPPPRGVENAWPPASPQRKRTSSKRSPAGRATAATHPPAEQVKNRCNISKVCFSNSLASKMKRQNARMLCCPIQKLCAIRTGATNKRDQLFIINTVSIMSIF